MIIIAIDFVVWKEHMQWKSWRSASIEGREKITRYNTIATKGSPKERREGRKGRTGQVY